MDDDLSLHQLWFGPAQGNVGWDSVPTRFPSIQCRVGDPTYSFNSLLMSPRISGINDGRTVSVR